MPRSPLKILRRFTPTHDDVLAPGDMLYLPPHIAHDGVAIDACTTYSIGFRAPGATELAAAFLDFLRDELDLPGRYADPDLAPSARRRRSAPRCAGAACGCLKGIRWDRATVARFLGCWLSEPKPHVFFEPPAHRCRRAAFGKRAAKHGAHVDRRTRLLYDDAHLFINGAALPWPASGAATLRRLANDRALATARRREACPRKRRRSSTLGTAMATSTPASPDGGDVDVRCRGTRRSRPLPSRSRRSTR